MKPTHDNREGDVVPARELTVRDNRIAELEQSITYLNQMGMNLLRSSSYLGGIIEFFQQCAESQDPFDMALAMESALASYTLPYLFILNLPEQHYIYSSEGYITLDQARALTHLTQQPDRMITYEQGMIVNYPYFSLWVLLAEEQGDQHLDNLTKLCGAANFMLEAIIRAQQERRSKEVHRRESIKRTQEMLDDIMRIEVNRSVGAMQNLSDLRWTIESAILKLDLDSDIEQHIVTLLERLLKTFESQHASSRLIGDYINNVKENLTEFSVTSFSR
ncbi:hypothetical protein ONV78_04980 [Hahella sp. CR1]|uniref:hypothetical protein n=1 Tax=Hahella sp. CR1 TaxID=2992807 RepID=UPI002442D327|nr:hypothetical protein [Hahella sp. CR1]MDG9667082.1 hypothetical protein [Hahella sp. CR1]